MKLVERVRFIFSLLLAALATAATAAPTWDPTITDTTPFQDLEAKLVNANAVLYLDNRCRVLALVVPQAGDLYLYVPQFVDISNNWWLRTPRYNVNKCGGDKWKYLDSKLKDHVGDPNACKPNKFVDANALQSATCQIDVGKIDSVVVLDKFFGTIVIVTGALAQTTARTEIPAVDLGRTGDGYQDGQPCYPPIPNPCPTGQNGALKCVGSPPRCSCVCQ